jgi:hypothetical protein
MQNGAKAPNSIFISYEINRGLLNLVVLHSNVITIQKKSNKQGQDLTERRANAADMQLDTVAEAVINKSIYK